MRLENHMYVADKTADIIENIVGVKFMRRLMRIGACTPDLQPLRRMQIHSPKIVVDHFEREFSRIVDHEKRLPRVSFILGLLSHYIADAFCLAHNIYTIDMAKHIQYEYALNEHMLNICLPHHLTRSVEEQVEILQNGVLTVEEYMKKSAQSYLDTIAKRKWEEIMAVDMEYAVLHGAALLTHFVLELQSIELPAVCIIQPQN